MIWKILSFGDYHFDDAFLADQDNPALQPIVASEMIKRGLTAAPAPGGVVREGDYLMVSVIGLSPVQRRELLRAIDVLSGRLEELLGEDNQGSQWYVLARPVRHVWDKGRDVIVFEVPDRIWRSATQRSESWTVTASGQSHELTVLGNRKARPVIELTPRQAKSGGFAYRRWVRVYNPNAVAMPNYPVDLTGGWGLDTAALVSAGKCQADGDDIWVLVDGYPVSRWIAGMNSSTTAIIATISFSPKIEMTLGAAIAGSGGVSEIVLERTTANQKALAELAMVANRMVLIDNEVFVFGGVDVTNCKLLNVQRAQRGSAAAAHSVGATIRWIEHDIWVLYGNPLAAAPDEDRSKKPIWKLGSSTPTVWAYDEFYDSTAPQRPGSWVPGILKSAGGESGWYGGEQGADADPAIRMGMRARAWQSGISWKAENAQIEWRWEHPGGATQVSCSGKKYRYSSNYATVAGLQKTNTTTWVTVWSENSPSSAQVWSAFSRNGVSLAGTYTKLRFFFQCNLAGTANNEADLQIDSVTVTLDGARIPQVQMGGEESNYWMDTTLRVEETGEEIYLRGICPLNATLIVDCENKMVSLNGENALSFLSFSSVRDGWLDLPPGTVTITMEDQGLTRVDISVSWEDRSL